jgi:3-oxoacyl-[acyl-carrier-protein] synthase II
MWVEWYMIRRCQFVCNAQITAQGSDMREHEGDGQRVVVTGVGVISPIGCAQERFWESLIQGRSGIGALRQEPDVGSAPDDVLATKVAGRIGDFAGRIEDFGLLDPGRKKAISKALKLMNRETQMGVAAAQQALADSNLLAGAVDPQRIGVCFGAGNVSMLPEDFVAGIQACTDQDQHYDFNRWGTEGLGAVAPLWLLKCLPNMPACYMAIFNDLRGPNNSITQEAAPNLAIAEACNILHEDAAEAIVVGGTGTTLQPFNLIHHLLSHEISRGEEDPSRSCRPFDLYRTGSVLAEGAAALILETWASAQRRGAPVYGEVLGTGASCVIDRDRTPHMDRAMVNAMRSALARAGLGPDAIDHVHAHGLGARQADIEEARAIRTVFGSRADRLPIVAAKSYMGNAGAGSGAIELVASLLALKHGRLFRVLNFENADPECPIAPVSAQEVPAGCRFLNVNAGSNGQASCVVMGLAAA